MTGKMFVFVWFSVRLLDFLKRKCNAGEVMKWELHNSLHYSCH